ncbi:alcohol dehydrogenase [Penicillium chermesinum]|uniref:Alcohol dehydrogenase n=1 Tax=Penicillium chermesinum TaxID=63820 RepID=A0A9W9PGG4_9EURO|nr:alcohol dehydrogenase [Penicillium chermesinum]KAJ5246254.1 alcohol dehydrogenase [Penicillium chermesinum]
MTSFENQAALQIEAKARPFKVGPGPVPNPSEDEVVIKVAYVAINPVDHIVQATPIFEYPYPYVLGTDVAGTVAQLGSNVTRFKLGQRVIGHCDGLLTKKPTNNAFQAYSTCREVLMAEVPDSLPLANAAVLPLGFSTAASGLYINLKLPLPSLDPKPTGKKILIWGGSSSVGSSTIQLAVASGLEVLTTASPANHEYAKCNDIFAHIGGRGSLPLVLPPQGTFAENVVPEYVNGLAPGMTHPEIGDGTWRKFLGQALAAGKFQAKPDPKVITGGLEKIQEGVDLLKKGVSATKIVVEISKE